MLINHLTLALVITSNLIISCQSASTNFYKRAVEQPQGINLPDRRHIFNKSEFLETRYSNRGAEFVKRIKRADLLRKWNIRPVQIQLDIIIERYQVVKQKMEELYFGVIGCGVTGCQNFASYIPKTKHEPTTKFFSKNQRHLGKKIYELLQTFHEGLKKIESSYDLMVKYENISGFYNHKRLELLQELKLDIKVLNVEVESGLTVKLPEIISKKEDTASTFFPFPSNQTDLIIQEWYVIQRSKHFLTEWRKILDDLEDQIKHLRGSGRKRSKKSEKFKRKFKNKLKMQKKKSKKTNGNRKSPKVS